MKTISNKSQGILYIVLAGFFFASMSLLVRLAGELPTMQKAFFRNAVALVVSLVLLSRTEEKFRIKKQSIPFLFLRSVFGTIGLISNFYALDKMGLADANMLNKLSPFFVIILSAIILHEKADFVEWACVAVAFIGALFIIKPSFNITSVYGLVGLLGGFGAGMAYTFVRKLGILGERGPVIVAFFSLFSCLVTLPFFIVQYEKMTIVQLLLLICAGVMATGGQLCITKAYTKAPAREISVFDYSQIVFSALLGFIFFTELPDYLSFIGYAIIICVAVIKWRYGLKKA